MTDNKGQKKFLGLWRSIESIEVLVRLHALLECQLLEDSLTCPSAHLHLYPKKSLSLVASALAKDEGIIVP
jgi:hypothetical protein